MAAFGPKFVAFSSRLKPASDDDPKFERNAPGFDDDGAEFVQDALLFIWTTAFLCAIECCQIELAKILKSYLQIRRHCRSRNGARKQDG